MPFPRISVRSEHSRYFNLTGLFHWFLLLTFNPPATLKIIKNDFFNSIFLKCHFFVNHAIISFLPSSLSVYQRWNNSVICSQGKRLHLGQTWHTCNLFSETLWIFDTKKGRVADNIEDPLKVIYIYIVIHIQICFVLSEHISVAWQYLPVAGIETRLTQRPSQSF